jgi:hypothetical protein
LGSCKDAAGVKRNINNRLSQFFKTKFLISILVSDTTITATQEGKINVIVFGTYPDDADAGTRGIAIKILKMAKMLFLFY